MHSHKIDFSRFFPACIGFVPGGTMEGEGVAPAIKGAKEMRQASSSNIKYINKHASNKHDWQCLFCKKPSQFVRTNFLPL